jgi:TatD DNase family protein
MYCDSHAHITLDSMFNNADEFLSNAKGNKVTIIVNVCLDQSGLDRGLLIKKRYPWIYNAAATHPHDADREDGSFFSSVEKSAVAKELIAIGETGLDYHYAHSSQKGQKKLLIRYFALASSVKLPIIFHCREAFADLFVLADEYYKGKPAVVHCFTGSLAEAQKSLDRGWYISVSGIVGFKKSQALRDVLSYVPLDRLLIETDSPFLAPESQRGKMNQPSYIVETAAVLAGVKGVAIEELSAALMRNSRLFFHL